MEEENVANASQEYSVDCTVCHVGKSGNVIHVLRLYGYTPTEDTVVPPSHIPEHFVTRH